jgi:hypothetical protein
MRQHKRADKPALELGENSTFDLFLISSSHRPASRVFQQESQGGRGSQEADIGRRRCCLDRCQTGTRRSWAMSTTTTISGVSGILVRR